MKQKGLIALYGVNFIGSLGFSLVIPFLIFLVERFGGNAIIYGVILASYSLFQLVGAPLLGAYSDRVGRKKVLLISQFGTLIAWFVLLYALYAPKIELLAVESALLGDFMLTLPLLILFLARALDGLTGGNISVANAYLVDVSSEQERAKNFGRMSAASNLGFIIGPVIAGLLGATRYKELLPVLAAILVSTYGLYLIWRHLPEQNKDATTSEEVSTKPKSKNAFSEVLSLKCVPAMLLLYFLIFLAFNIFYTAFPVHAAKTLAWSSLEMGIYFSVLSGLMVFVQGPVLGRLSQKFSSPLLSTAGMAIMVLSFVCLLSENLVLIYLSAALFATGNGIGWPSFMDLLGQIGNKNQQGTLQGLATSSGSVASILGLVAGGVVYTSFGASTFGLGAGVFVVVIGVMLWAFRARTWDAKVKDPSC